MKKNCSESEIKVSEISVKRNQSKQISRFLPLILLVIFALVIVWLIRNPLGLFYTSANKNPQYLEENEHNSLDMQAILEEIVRLEKLIMENPKDFESLLTLAHRYQDTGQLQKSIDTYKKFLNYNPADVEARIDLGVSYYRMAFEDTIDRKIFFQKSITEIQSALRYAPTNQLAHFNLGVVNWQSGNIYEAKNCFNKCIEINPETDIAIKALKILREYIN